MSLNAREQAVVEHIAEHEDELISLVSDLIAFDTTARAAPEDRARDERPLQQYLAERLASAGAGCDLWEPAPEDVAGTKLAPTGLDFEGRPQLAATFRGKGGGRSLLLNGHVDAVSPEPRERWTSDPFRAKLRDGRLYGRGACDMKGGVACMVFAAEALSQLGIRLAGDLIVCTVTEEESTGAGGLAAVARGVRADAGIVLEPSSHEICIACRGSVLPTITVPGRPGHSGIPQPDWRQGGAVNAIEKAELVLDAMRRLQEDWRSRPDQRHPLLSQGDIVPCVIAGGEWAVSYPSSCSITYHIGYLPAFADAEGWGSRIELEVTECVQRAAEADPWLAENPPTIDWAPEVPSAEVDADAPIVSTLLAAASDAGLTTRIAGFDNWHDGATFTRLGGTPCVAFGPSGLDRAHTVDEYVPIESLVSCAQAIAVAAIRFCDVGE
ncbi:MAG: ArgE/DapE family deacylase [Actinobacteria bacterium]|nr:ArgE/DapE family deacylase [Actinomycetota bacterium]